MVEQSYIYINKDKWDDGPWKDEPDKVQFLCEGLPCVILRSSTMGFLCGYVGLTKHHPDYGKDYDDISVDCWGGLTFSGFSHKPKDFDSWHGIFIEGLDDLFFVGFDCGHSNDKVPNGFWNKTAMPGATYKNINFVKSEVKKLAKQLRDRAWYVPGDFLIGNLDESRDRQAG